MKIYFAGSIRGGRSDKEIYLEIVKLLKDCGEVLTEHIADSKLTSLGEVDLENEHIYERDMAWLKDADVLVAEVTVPSLGVGYEIASAEKLNKKMLCLYREGAEKSLSSMIRGNRNLTVKIYKTINDLPEILKNFLK